VTGPQFIDLIGGLLEALGILVAGIGLRKTWREFAPAGEHLLDPVSELLQSAASSLRVRLDRVLGRPRPVTVTPGPASLEIRAFEPRVVVGYAPLPLDVETADAIAQLDGRTRDLVNQLSNVEDRLGTKLGRIAESVTALDAREREDIASVQTQDVRIATGGIRLEVAGLTLVGGGLLLQLVARVLGAWSATAV
jgi:hypothetical protein